MPNLTSCLSDVFVEKSYCDVTLVSDDRVPFKAHKIVLGASSSFFKDILVHNPHPHPLIYLKGIKHQDLSSILQFIYLGKTQIYTENVERFAQITRYLKITKLDDHIQSDKKVRVEDMDVVDIQENHQDRNEWNSTICSKSIEEKNSFNQVEVETSKHMYECGECDAEYIYKGDLLRHVRIKHKGLMYSCQICGYKASRPNLVKQHFESSHIGIKYHCKNCDYQATQKNILKTHQESVHDGVKYQCNNCEYEFTLKSSLRRHKSSVHVGIKYQCSRCNFQTTRRDFLNKHQNTKHT